MGDDLAMFTARAADSPSTLSAVSSWQRAREHCRKEVQDPQNDRFKIKSVWSMCRVLSGRNWEEIIERCQGAHGIFCLWFVRFLFWRNVKSAETGEHQGHPVKPSEGSGEKFVDTTWDPNADENFVPRFQKMSRSWTDVMYCYVVEICWDMLRYCIMLSICLEHKSMNEWWGLEPESWTRKEWNNTTRKQHQKKCKEVKSTCDSCDMLLANGTCDTSRCCMWTRRSQAMTAQPASQQKVGCEQRRRGSQGVSH